VLNINVLCACVYIYIYMFKCILQPFRGAKEKGKWKGDGADDPKPRARWPALSQSHEPVLEASSSCRTSKMRPAASKTSRADFGSWGMSWTISMPRSTRASKIPTTCHDSHSASVAHSPLITTTRTWVLPSSTDRSLPSGGMQTTFFLLHQYHISQLQVISFR
jgi:hypothetical protein